MHGIIIIMCSTIDGSTTNFPEPHTLPGTMSLVSRDQTTNFYRALSLAVLRGAYTASDNARAKKYYDEPCKVS